MTEDLNIFESAYLLNGVGGARKISGGEVNTWSPTDGVIWLDCDLTKPAVQSWVSDDSGSSRTIVDILLAGETRPRLITEGEGLAIILRGINMNPGAVPDDMVSVRIWLEKSRIITSHRRLLLSIDDLRQALELGKGPKTIGEFLITMIACLSERIGTAVENIENLIASVEEDVATGDTGALRTSLSVVRRQAAAIRRYLAPQRDALDRLVRSSTDLVTDAEVSLLREEGDTLTRHLEDLDLAREQALVAQEELMNRFAQEQNSRMYLLSVVAAVFLPLTFITGLFGMNVAGLPGTENPNGFVYSALIMVACGIALAIYFRWKKWI